MENKPTTPKTSIWILHTALAALTVAAGYVPALTLESTNVSTGSLSALAIFVLLLTCALCAATVYLFLYHKNPVGILPVTLGLAAVYFITSSPLAVCIAGLYLVPALCITVCVMRGCDHRTTMITAGVLFSISLALLGLVFLFSLGAGFSFESLKLKVSELSSAAGSMLRSLVNQIADADADSLYTATKNALVMAIPSMFLSLVSAMSIFTLFLVNKMCKISASAGAGWRFEMSKVSAILFLVLFALSLFVADGAAGAALTILSSFLEFLFAIQGALFIFRLARRRRSSSSAMPIIICAFAAFVFIQFSIVSPLLAAAFLSNLMLFFSIAGMAGVLMKGKIQINRLK